jgi:hypothetical protein
MSHPAAANYLSRKRRTLITLVVATATFGILVGAPDGAGYVNSVAAVVQIVVKLTLAVRWCRDDAEERGFTLWRRFSFCTIVFPGPFLMVPIYLIKSRGNAGIVSCGYFVILATSIGAIEVAAMYVGTRLGELR